MRRVESSTHASTFFNAFQPLSTPPNKRWGLIVQLSPTRLPAQHVYCMPPPQATTTHDPPCLRLRLAALYALWPPAGPAGSTAMLYGYSTWMLDQDCAKTQLTDGSPPSCIGSITVGGLPLQPRCQLVPERRCHSLCWCLAVQTDLQVTGPAAGECTASMLCAQVSHHTGSISSREAMCHGACRLVFMSPMPAARANAGA